MKSLRHRPIRFIIVPLMLASFLTACAKWAVQEVTPSEVVTDKQPDRVRLTLLDDSKLVLDQPRVSGAEIVGERVDGGYLIRADTVRIASDSVAYAEIRTTSTALWIGIVLLTVGTVFVLDMIRGWRDYWGG